MASARAELLSLRNRVEGAEAIARQNREEVLQRRTLEREHAPMLQGLRNRAMKTHEYRGSIVVLSISKSVEPNEEQKKMISGFQ